MPYKDPERKQQWEREHRVEPRFRGHKGLDLQLSSPCISLFAHAKDQPASGWKVLAGLIGVGIALFLALPGAALSGVPGPEPSKLVRPKSPGT